MKYLVRLMYDGFGLSGFAVQPNKNTVQDHINSTISGIFDEDIKVLGSSRTDAGVHAYDQVVTFSSDRLLMPDKLKYAINGNIIEQIKCVSAEYVDDMFDCRKMVISKTYKYVISKEYNPIFRNYMYYHKKKFSVEKMKEAATYFIGTHDFTSFCATKTHVENKRRTINYIDIIESEESIELLINGNGFLYNMVRIMVGTLLMIGESDMNPSYIEDIINERDREKAGMTVPSYGLFLMKTNY